MKTCSLCGLAKPIAGFYRDRTCRDGRSGSCKDCVRLRAKDWYSINRERALANVKKWAALNAPKRATYCRRWLDKNPWYSAVSSRRWREANLERWRASKVLSEGKRRARKVHSIGSIERLDVARVRRLQRDRCAICRCRGSKLHVDHVVPLALGGANDAANIQLLCPPCNRRKWAKDPIVHMRELGRLL